MTRSLILSTLILSFSISAFARRDYSLEDTQDWAQFQNLIERQQAEEMKTGQAYVISGSLLILGGIIGYHNARTPIEKLAYSVSQSLGVAGVGYGSYLHSIGSDQRSFYESVLASKSLSTENKNELVQNYVRTWRENRQNEKMIKIVTHSIVAAVNLYNGLREEGELRQGLVALGGINFLAAVSISFQ